MLKNPRVVSVVADRPNLLKIKSYLILNKILNNLSKYIFYIILKFYRKKQKIKNY